MLAFKIRTEKFILDSHGGINKVFESLKYILLKLSRWKSSLQKHVLTGESDSLKTQNYLVGRHSAESPASASVSRASRSEEEEEEEGAW